ncbi:hypothetical protein [Roseimicrobium sp. ORNL1]|uniref:hypothetical protein n=1 Tax=Roseimicrobium sp. ORNL1 TaxID=2711231 RepID=UPI0013E15E07|nr:hypothetical protein [Roseimicrobium sp. ORNL1]QIF02749.1 hypothetical protein G5S37_14870 [Roseimicrobium sp. ORNL1]
MRTPFSNVPCWLGCCCCLMLSLTGIISAQVPIPQVPVLETFVPPEARLEMMEKTYATNLRPIHSPVMQDYLRELDLLKSKMTASGRAADAVAVEAEIARIRQAMTTTGVFPYEKADDASSSADPAKGSGAAPDAAKPAPDSSSRAVLTLQAAKANGGMATTGGANAAPLGALDWTVEKLVAGTYDVAAVYACPALDTPELINVSIAGNARVFTLPADRATGSDKDFRIFRLGTITIEKDVAAGTMHLQSQSPSPRLFIRSVILSRPKAAAPAQPAAAGS